MTADRGPSGDLPRFEPGRLLRAAQMNQLVEHIDELRAALGALETRISALQPSTDSREFLLRPTYLPLLTGPNGPNPEQPTFPVELVEFGSDGRESALRITRIRVKSDGPPLVEVDGAARLRPVCAGEAVLGVEFANGTVDVRLSVRALDPHAWSFRPVFHDAHATKLMRSVFTKGFYDKLPGTDASHHGPQTLAGDLLPAGVRQDVGVQMVVLFQCTDRPQKTTLRVFGDDKVKLCEESFEVVPSIKADRFQEAIIAWRGRATRVEIQGAVALAVGHQREVD